MLVNDDESTLSKVITTLSFVIFVVGLVFISLFGVWGIYDGLRERSLIQSLTEETEAVLVACDREARICTITYEFTVNIEGNIKKYLGQENASCPKCIPIDSVGKIIYDPQNPNISRLKGNDWTQYQIGLAIGIFVIMFMLLIIGKVKERGNIFLRRSSNGD